MFRIASDCQTRWLRLRQRFSKERQQRKQETRSGAAKSIRQQWPLFDQLNFLGRFISQRKSFSNVGWINANVSESSISIYEQNKENQDDINKIQKPMEPLVVQTPISPLQQPTPSPLLRSTPSPLQQLTPLPLQRSSTPSPLPLQRSSTPSPLPLQRSSTPSSLPLQQLSPLPLQRLTPSPSQRSSCLPIQSSPASLSCETSSFEKVDNSQTFTSSSNISPCFARKNRMEKKGKVDPVETAFHQMNSTLNTMISTINMNKNVDNTDDTDILIGKLVTAELKKATEPKKTILKKKFMQILYFSDDENN